MTAVATEPLTVPFVQSCTDFSVDRCQAAGLRLDQRELQAHPYTASVITPDGEIILRISAVCIVAGRCAGQKNWLFKGHLPSDPYTRVEVRWNYITQRGLITRISLPLPRSV